jgi:hypothetical protein
MEARRRQTPERSNEHGRDRLHLTSRRVLTSDPPAAAFCPSSACLIFLLCVLAHSFLQAQVHLMHMYVYIFSSLEGSEYTTEVQTPKKETGHACI